MAPTRYVVSGTSCWKVLLDNLVVIDFLWPVIIKAWKPNELAASWKKRIEDEPWQKPLLFNNT